MAPTGASADIACIAPAQLDEVWPHVAHLIRKACNKTGLSDFHQLERALFNVEALLWVAGVDVEITAAAVTQVSRCNAHKFCTIVACGAQARMDLWLPLLREIDAYAKQQGCAAMRIFGRRGWRRVLKDYELTGYILERTL